MNNLLEYEKYNKSFTIFDSFDSLYHCLLYLDLEERFADFASTTRFFVDRTIPIRKLQYEKNKLINIGAIKGFFSKIKEIDNQLKIFLEIVMEIKIANYGDKGMLKRFIEEDITNEIFKLNEKNEEFTKLYIKYGNRIANHKEED